MNTIFKDRQGGLWVYWIDDPDSGGRIYLNPDSIPGFLNQDYRIVVLYR